MTQKRGRRTRAELREMMLDAGREVLYEVEPTLGFEELTYSTVFQHLLETRDQKVTIGSVHERIWPSQRAFQLDVLAMVIAAPIETSTGEMAERNAKILTELAGVSVQSRRYALQTAVRLSSELLWEKPDSQSTRIMHTIRFRLWAMGDNHPEASDFIGPLIAIRQATTAAYLKVVYAAMEALNLRVRADAGDPRDALEALAVLGNAATVGLRADVLPQVRRERLLPTGPNDEDEAWHFDSINLWALARNTLEFADDGLSPEERRL